jgi:hypothetical protein
MCGAIPPLHHMWGLTEHRDKFIPAFISQYADWVTMGTGGSFPDGGRAPGV